VNGEPNPRSGPVQVLQTEVLVGPGATFTFQLRAAFRSGDDLLIS